MMHLVEAWQQLVCDLYEHRQKHCLLILDYCSRFVKVTQLRNTVYSTAMSQATGIFTRHSMYSKLICKSSLQYIPKGISEICKGQYFIHTTSSLYYLQCNRMPESTHLNNSADISQGK